MNDIHERIPVGYPSNLLLKMWLNNSLTLPFIVMMVTIVIVESGTAMLVLQLYYEFCNVVEAVEQVGTFSKLQIV